MSEKVKAVRNFGQDSKNDLGLMTKLQNSSPKTFKELLKLISKTKVVLIQRRRKSFKSREAWSKQSSQFIFFLTKIGHKRVIEIRTCRFREIVGQIAETTGKSISKAPINSSTEMLFTLKESQLIKARKSKSFGTKISSKITADK